MGRSVGDFTVLQMSGELTTNLISFCCYCAIDVFLGCFGVSVLDMLDIYICFVIIQIRMD